MAPQWRRQWCLVLLGIFIVQTGNGLALENYWNETTAALMRTLASAHASARAHTSALHKLYTADQSDSHVLAAIADAHERGAGTGANASEAVRWYRAAAELGDVYAHWRLAVLHSLGIGTARDDARSLVHLTFAASADEQQQPTSMQAAAALGYRYMNGHGVQESCYSALLYYQQAARSVLTQVAKPGGHSNLHAARIGRGSSSRSAHTRERDIVQYYEYSAQIGSSDAQNTLGQLHALGVNGLTKDYNLARRYFEKASNRGDADALANLGLMYANGLGCKPNNETAVKFLSQSAQSGNHVGQAGLGCLHLLGYGLKRDPAKAARYLHASAEQGDPSAQFFLAIMHWHGEGVRADRTRALHYMALAAHRGHPSAMYHLALIQLDNNPLRCTQPSLLMKAVAERGEWAFAVEEAHGDYINGNQEAALRKYLSLGEAGMEVAQWNAGVLLEEGAGESTMFTAQHDRLRLAQRMYRRSADQGFPAAIVKVGDSLFEGWTGDAPDKERAAALYRYASENSRLAQATFNLGLLHETGNGLPQDLHLAKRYYDLARSHHWEAWLPTAVTLTRVTWKALAAGTYDQLGAPSASSPPSTALAIEDSSGRVRIVPTGAAVPLAASLLTFIVFVSSTAAFVHAARNAARQAEARRERQLQQSELADHPGR